MTITIDDNGWIKEAQDGHYGAKSWKGRNGYSIKYLCQHGTAGGESAAETDNWFTNGTDAAGNPIQASSHLIIDQAGNIIQGISLLDSAWGNGYVSDGHAAWLPAGNPNWYTISIENVKASDDNSNALTDAQKRANFEVSKAICDKYHIPWKYGDASGGIISHADIDPANRSHCPGLFPWDEMWAYGRPPVPIQENKFMDQAMQNCWQATKLQGLNYSSGIAAAWKAEYKAGRQYGPPITSEYASVDWSGNPIIVQEFPGARCEWHNGTANWIKR